ncbi:MAG: hypothetical protein KGS72_24775 [Cyanobacteria bacterium REEB67]|nr:hypothetical protein [Cyanobacteria bacterium REEB67]
MLQKSDRNGRSPRPYGSWLSLLCAPVLAQLLTLATASPAHSQSAVDQVHLITGQQPVLLAQITNGTTPGILPTDATKTGILQERTFVDPGWRLRFNQKLPAALYFNIQTEVTQRLETNVFLNYKNPQPDFVFRINPNVTVGYNIFSNTAVYASYFMIRDNYMTHNRHLSEPVTQSLQMGIRHTFMAPKIPKLQLAVDLGARELWQAKGLRQSDLIPSVNATYFLGQRTIAFASALLQMRGQSPFVGPTREMDPFYTVGFVSGHGPWTFSIYDTFVTNFREPHFRYSIPKQGNVSMIADFEIARQLSKRLSGVQTFLRAEPVFNWRSNNVRGLSGFDFRLYGGMRFNFNKQSQLATINAIKKSLQQQDGDAAFKNKKKGKKGKSAPGVSPTQNPDGTPTVPSAPAETKDEKTGSAPALIQPGIASLATDAVTKPESTPAIAPDVVPTAASDAKVSVDATAPAAVVPNAPTAVESPAAPDVPVVVPTASGAPGEPTASNTGSVGNSINPS